jgi:hypothetical protein
MAKSRKKGHAPRKVLRIPDLEHSKIAVLNSLPAKASQVSYEYAIDEFISWYCSEPRLAFNRTVVLRYRFSRRATIRLNHKIGGCVDSNSP